MRLRKPTTDFDPAYELEQRLCLFADGDDDGDGGDGDGDGDGDAEAAAAAAAAKTAEDEAAAAAAAADTDTSWRDGIVDAKLKEHASRFNSLDDLVKGNVDQRVQLSKTISLPGKNADDAELAEYHKAIGVPADESEYWWPEVPDGVELPQESVDDRKEWSAFFKEHHYTAAQARAAVDRVVTQDLANLANIKEADEQHARASEAALRTEWGNEYEANIEYQNRALTAYFGEDLADARHLEDSTGRYVLDNPLLIKAFARLGREMGDGGLGPALNNTERETIDDQILDVRKRAEEANRAGNRAMANKLSNEERELIARRDGGGAVVGQAGVTV